MNRLEFLGKLRMVYCGDKNAFDEISAEQERLSIIEEKHKDCTQYYVNGFKEEIDRLNNIIKELSKDVDMWNKKYNEQFNIINELEKWLNKILEIYDNVDVKTLLMFKDKLIELKENNKDE